MNSQSGTVESPPQPEVVIKYLAPDEAKWLAQDIKDTVDEYNRLLSEAKRMGLYVSLGADRKTSSYDYSSGYVGSDKIKVSITGNFSL